MLGRRPRVQPWAASMIPGPKQGSQCQVQEQAGQIQPGQVDHCQVGSAGLEPLHRC